MNNIEYNNSTLLRLLVVRQQAQSIGYKLPQSKIAAVTSMSISSISRWERGLLVFQTANLDKINDYLAKIEEPLNLADTIRDLLKGK